MCAGYVLVRCTRWGRTDRMRDRPPPAPRSPGTAGAGRRLDAARTSQRTRIALLGSSSPLVVEANGLGGLSGALATDRTPCRRSHVTSSPFVDLVDWSGLAGDRSAPSLSLSRNVPGWALVPIRRGE